MSKKNKIAIIGAGPSGITMALELKDRGYEDITIFGYPEEAQCKTLQIEGVVADVAACYTHPGYWNTVRRLLKRAKMSIKHVGMATLLDENYQPIAVSFKERLSLKLKLLYFIFISFWWRIFRFTSLSKNYSVSMEGYLKRHGLLKLINSMILGPGGNSQGYGFLDEVTAHHTLQWFCPSIFVSPFANAIKKGTGVIVEGYGGLFAELIKEFKLEKCHIQSVRPITADKQSVKLFTKNGEEHVFDHVVIACPLDQIESPASPLINSHTMTDSHLFSFLFSSKKEPNFKDRIYFMGSIYNKSKNEILTMRTWGKTPSGVYVYWCVGYATKDVDQKSLEKLLTEKIENQLKIPIDKVNYFNIFRYNIRFTSSAIKEGIHLQLQQMQGIGHIWYSGGFLSHWNIDSIHEFNKILAMKLDYNAKPCTFFRMLKYAVSWFLYRIESL